MEARPPSTANVAWRTARKVNQAKRLNNTHNGGTRCSVGGPSAAPTNTVMDGAARIIGFAVRSRLLRVAGKTCIDSSYETLLFVDEFDNARCRASDSSTSFLLEFRDGLTSATTARDSYGKVSRRWVILFRAPRGDPFFVVTSWSRVKRFERCLKFRRTRAICYSGRGKINNYSAISIERGDEASIR